MKPKDFRKLRQVRLTDKEFNFLLRVGLKRGLIAVGESETQIVRRTIVEIVIPILKTNPEQAT